MRVFQRTHPRRALESPPRRAIEADWRRHGRRVSRRVLLIVGVAVMGGPLAYIVVPQPVAAEPGVVHTAVVTSPVTVATSVNVSSRAAGSVPLIAPPAAFIGGVIDTGDLLSNPVGVTSTGADVAADGGLIGWPVSDHTPSTGFGYRSDPFTHRQRWHDGVDLGQPCGDAAAASLAGTVMYAGWAGGYGNRVIIQHAERGGHSFATTYNHLAKIEVTVGQQVTQGDVVGRIGSTGRSTACHLHFEVILDGSYVDPMRFLTGDTSKAGLSRRVGSFMPSGLPSPTVNSSSTPSPSRTRSASHTPTPSPTTPAPAVTTPGPSTSAPSPTTPSPTTPSPTTPAPTTPTPSPTTPTPSPTTTAGSTTPASSPASPSTHPATAGSSTGATPAAAASPQTSGTTSSDAVSTPS